MTEFKGRYIDLLVDRLDELDRQLEGADPSDEAAAKAKTERLSVAKEMHALSDVPLKSAREQVAAATARIMTSLAVGNGAGATVLTAALLRPDGAELGQGAVWAAASFVLGGAVVSVLPVFSMLAGATLLRAGSSAARSNGKLMTYMIASISCACFLAGALALVFSVAEARVPTRVPRAPDGELILISRAVHTGSHYRPMYLEQMGRLAN